MEYIALGGVVLGSYLLRSGYFVSEEAPKNLIDGKNIAKRIREEIKKEVEELKDKPVLAVVLVGDRKDSQTYVRMKKRACKEVGFTSIERKFPDTIKTEDLIREVRELNAESEVDGILVQLPLPRHVDEEAVLNEISLEKDVDGFHPLNIGKLCMKGRIPTAVPCTPEGCIELLDRMNVEISGKRAVVIGRSNIVGIPVSFLLMHRNATVTVVHSRTVNPEEFIREADIVVAACGQAQMVKRGWIKPGAAVIDVGINSIEDKTRKRGYRLVGDVDFEEVRKVAGLITPVPGGVGPMTIAMLLSNCLNLHKNRRGKNKKE